MSGGASTWHHEPVLVERVVELMRLQPGMQVQEACSGLGGHTKRFLEKIGERGHVWGFEVDPRVAEEARKRLGEYAGRFTIFEANFRDFDLYLKSMGVKQFDAFMADLGPGRYHYGEGYGQALKKELRIDFRLSPSLKIPTGAELIESASEAELRRLIQEAGERRFAGRVAKAIVNGRPVLTTGNLARIIEGAVPRKYHKPGVSPAQRIFAHIRAVVNDERGALAELMQKLTYWLRPGGRAVFLCYTSGELSQVRKYLKGKGCTCPSEIPKCVCGKGYAYKVLADGERPTEEEISENPSARSARLAAGELLYRPEEGTSEE